MSGLDLKKLRAMTPMLEERARQEKQEELKEYLESVDDIEKYIALEETKKSLKQSSRTLNNWTLKGAIAPIEEGKKRTFTKTEACWIQIVEVLKDFGLKLETIKEVREQIFTSKVLKFTPFQYAIISSILDEPYILMVQNDGQTNLMTTTDYQNYLTDDTKALPPHIAINLLSITEQEFPNNSFFKYKTEMNIAKLNEKELELYYRLRTGDYDEIKLRVKDGEIYLIESSKTLENNEKLIDIINKYAFQDIEIKVRNGKIILLKSTDFNK